MEKTELLKIYDYEQRIQIQAPGVRKEVGEYVTRHVILDEQFGFIPYTKLNEENADAEIDRQIAHFQSLGIDFEWKVYDHDAPADLRQRLAARGFENEEPEALMVLDLENAPGQYWTLDLQAAAPVTDAAGVDAIRKMEEEVWGTDHGWMNVRLAGDLRDHPERLDIFSVWDAGRIVSAAWIYYDNPSSFASLWGGTTLPAYRQRGYYTALLAARARAARQRGYRFLTVDASPMSRPILEKHGFQFLGFSTPCNWKNHALVEGAAPAL